MIRLGLVLAISAVAGACTAETSLTNAMETAEVNSATSEEPGSRTVSPMSNTKILISSDRGPVMAELVDNAATRALLRMLPLTLQMRDHLRQEKTGALSSPLPQSQRQLDFSAGTLGLWGDEDLVIYYRDGRVPPPGIIVLGRATGDLSIFDNPQTVTVQLQRAD